MRRDLARLLLPFLGTIFASCGGEQPSDDGVVRTDSAGVEIVFSARAAWNQGAGWRLAAEPLFQLGAVEGDASQIFDLVMGVRLLEGGGVAVAEWGSNTVRWYGRDGVLLRTAGGTGGGPGEFLQLFRLFQAGDRLWAMQAWGTGAVFDAGGRRLRSVEPPLEVGRTLPAGVFGDGSVLWNRFSTGFPVRPGVYEDSATLFRTSPAGRLDTVARLPDGRYVGSSGGGSYQDFGPLLWVAVGDSLLYAGYSDRFDVSVRRMEGSVVRRVRRAGEAAPLTEEHVEAILALRLEGLTPDEAAQMRAEYEAMVFPDHFPVHGTLLVDAAGDLWVRTLGALEGPITWGGVPPGETRWDVFDPSGRWLGVVAMPPRFRPDDIGEDRVAGVWKDALDVEYVRVYRLVKG